MTSRIYWYRRIMGPPLGGVTSSDSPEPLRGPSSRQACPFTEVAVRDHSKFQGHNSDRSSVHRMTAPGRPPNRSRNQSSGRMPERFLGDRRDHGSTFRNALGPSRSTFRTCPATAYTPAWAIAGRADPPRDERRYRGPMITPNAWVASLPAMGARRHDSQRAVQHRSSKLGCESRSTLLSRRPFGSLHLAVTGHFSDRRVWGRVLIRFPHYSFERRNAMAFARMVRERRSARKRKSARVRRCAGSGEASRSREVPGRRETPGRGAAAVRPSNMLGARAGSRHIRDGNLSQSGAEVRRRNRAP